MALLTVSIERTANAVGKSGAVSIKVKQTGTVLASHSQNFPQDTADSYVLSVLLGRAREMMVELAMKQVPANLSFDVDSDQVRLRRLFDL